MHKSVLKAVMSLSAVATLAGVFAFQGCSDTNEGGSAGSINSGNDALKNGNFDEAMAYYEAAYQKDNNDPDAIIYSSLAKLAQISVDPKVVNLFQNRFGFTKFPNKLNGLLSNDWLVNYTSDEITYGYLDANSGKYVYWYYDNEYGADKGAGYYSEEQVFELVSTTYNGSDWYYDERYEDFVEWYAQEDLIYYPQINKPGYYYRDWKLTLVSSTPRYGSELPELLTPDWIKGGSNSIYNKSLIRGRQSLETYPILLLANLLDKNTSGLNGLLDDVIDAVFGAPFDEACARIKRLEGSKLGTSLSSIAVDGLNLGDVFDEFDQVGWPELNAVLSFMTGIKASLQYVAAYNWNTDLSFLKFAWTENVDDFYDALDRVSPSNLPFGNDFLKARPGKMAASKTSFITAIEGLKASYGAIQNSTLYPQEVKDAYPTLSQGADKLIAAIRDGGKFYIPEDPTYGNWPTSGNGIDMGKFFQEGFFSLQNLFETDGNKPVFYADINVDIGDYNLVHYDLKLTRDNYSLSLSDVLDLGGLGWIFGIFDVNIPIGGLFYEGADISIGLKLKKDHLQSLFVGEELFDDDDVVAYIFNPRLGSKLFEKFYDVKLISSPLLKKRPQQLAHAKAHSRK